MADPLVSIVMPTYNRAAYLPRAVRSVLAQTIERWELLVEDDGSTDASEAVLRDLQNADPRIRVNSHPNTGPAASRNSGMARAHGAFIAFLDSDDEYHPTHLARRLRFMREHEDVDFLHGGAVILGSRSQQFVPDRNDRSKSVPIDQCIIGGTFFARRGVIEAAGGWRSCFAEDADLFERVRENFGVRLIEDMTYFYHRDTEDSRCSQADRS